MKTKNFKNNTIVTIELFALIYYFVHISAAPCCEISHDLSHYISIS